MSFDSYGNIYVTDRDNHRVQKILKNQLDSKFLLFWFEIKKNCFPRSSTNKWIKNNNRWIELFWRKYNSNSNYCNVNRKQITLYVNHLFCFSRFSMIFTICDVIHAYRYTLCKNKHISILDCLFKMQYNSFVTVQTKIQDNLKSS